jgi:hypothetical protein
MPMCISNICIHFVAKPVFIPCQDLNCYWDKCYISYISPSNNKKNGSHDKSSIYHMLGNLLVAPSPIENMDGSAHRSHRPAPPEPPDGNLREVWVPATEQVRSRCPHKDSNR